MSCLQYKEDLSREYFTINITKFTKEFNKKEIILSDKYPYLTKHA
jgi:hypothetical protein